MQTSPAGIALLREYEGFSSVFYTCPAGVRTIGYGHAVKPGDTIEEPITEEQARAILRDDLGTAEAAVNRLVTAPLTQGQFDALCSLAFNIGAGAFGKSTLLRKLNAGEYESAADEFDRWVYAGGRVLRGLQHRRKAEKALFQSKETNHDHA